ncbi:MAG: hypothetical protein Q8O55_07310 [Dehalococcoidales bacterium]|nr:hypothetical protein [Dehalococcoidales bacterium]
MAEDSKPRKKKLNLSEVLSDPAKVIGELLEDPDVADKLALAVSKLPPAAMDVLAQKIAEYMPKPATADEIAERLEVRMPEEAATPGNNGDIAELKNQLADMVMDSFTKLQTQILQMLAQVKTMQDEQPALIQNNVASIFNQELKIFEEKAAIAKQELLTRAGNGNGGNGGGVAVATGAEDPPPPRGQGLILGLSLDQILSTVTTVADAWSKFKPPVAASLAEDKLKAYAVGFASGNKMRGGVVGPDEVAKEMLQIAAPPAPQK